MNDSSNEMNNAGNTDQSIDDSTHEPKEDGVENIRKESYQQESGYEETRQQEYSYDEMNQQENAYDNTYQQENPYGEPKKLHVPGVIIAFLLIVVILDLVCMIRFPKVLSEYKVYKLAEERIANGETSAAINDLYSVAEKHKNSIPIMVELVELSMENGYYDTAGYIIDTYLVGRSLGDEEYDEINGYYEKLDSYYNTYDAVDKIVNNSSAQNTDDESYYEGIKKQLNDLLAQSGMDQAYIYYWLGLVEADTKSARADMQKCYDNDPECLDVRVQLSIMSRRLGDMEAAKRYGDEAYQKDKQDSGALRALSTIALAEGNLKEGLQYAEIAYQIDPDGTYIRDNYLVALYANGKTEDAQEIKEEIEGQGQSLDEDTASLLKGEITVRQYYVEE